MARRRRSDCGPNIDTENVEFSRRESNLVYLDKVYSFNHEKASVFLQGLNTSTTPGFVTELELGNSCGCGSVAGDRYNCGCGCNSNGNCGCGCNSNGNCGCGCNSNGNWGCGCNSNGNWGCGCNSCFPSNVCVVCCGSAVGGASCTIDSNAVFTVDSTYVLVDSMELSDPSGLETSDVTIDGNDVNSLTYESGTFTAGVNTLLPTVLRKKCTDSCLPTRVYFMVEGAGPWLLSATFVLEGTVTSGGRTCPFKLKVRNSDSTSISLTGTSSFAVSRLALPCAVNGVAPAIRFNFGAVVNILDPEITVTSGPDGGNTINLIANLAVQPKINVETVRKTMFCIDACESMVPCDGSMQKYTDELADDEEEDGISTYPPCSCGKRHSWEGCGSDEDDDEEGCGCGNVASDTENGCGCRNRRGKNGCGNAGNNCGCGRVKGNNCNCGCADADSEMSCTSCGMGVGNKFYDFSCYGF